MEVWVCSIVQSMGRFAGDFCIRVQYIINHVLTEDDFTQTWAGMMYDRSFIHAPSPLSFLLGLSFCLVSSPWGLIGDGLLDILKRGNDIVSDAF
jgi:hypothetical protein